jgi:GR25 family glycosyltransferase involved in LPS biosynthesis
MYISNPFVINLEKDKERWEVITGKLKERNIPYSRFEGVNGKMLPDSEIAKYTTWFNRTFLLTHSIIGCALSHFFVLDVARAQLLPQLKQMNEPLDTAWILVLEDDAVIDPNYHESMAKLKADLQWLHDNKPEEYNRVDMLKLCIPTRHLPSNPIVKGIITAPNSRLPTIEHPGEMNYSFKSFYVAASNTSYLVKVSSVDKFMNHLRTKGINTHVDVEIGWSKDINVYYVSEPIIDSVVDNFDTSTNLAGTYPRSIAYIVRWLNSKGLISAYTAFGVTQPVAGINMFYKFANIWFVLIIFVLALWLATRWYYKWNPWPYVLIFWIADTVFFYRQ